ncbi:hypothetical protein QUF64_08745 [Anaerolineales bacterium HSG6]|nr:hypothetical protein [Anaerolineales bacterium HSG6]MDM8530580.1 hypothetical protein [Anaerolineales bacterium HSG25]
MKPQELFTPNDQTSVWRNTDNPSEQFRDFNITFTRNLTPQERNQALAHFINGLAESEVTDYYTIYKVDFSRPNFLQLTFRLLAIDTSRSLGYLFVTFKENFPVSDPSKTFIDFD